MSLGDNLAGLHAAFGAVLALRARDADPLRRGQVVDVALTESVFNMLEAMIPESADAGVKREKERREEKERERERKRKKEKEKKNQPSTFSNQNVSIHASQVEREPSGSTISGVVPSATFRTKDGRWCVVGGNGDSVYTRLMAAVGRPEMGADVADSRFSTNAARCEAAEEIYGVIGDWVAQRTLDEVVEAMRVARVPAGSILRAKDLLKDEQFLARGMFQKASPPPPKDKSSPSSDLSFTIPAIVPVLSRTPGKTLWAGPGLGQHTEEVLVGEAGFSKEEFEALKREGAIV